MRSKKTPVLLTAFLAIAGVMWATTPAQASFRLRIEQLGSTGVVVTDNVGAGDLNASLGAITVLAHFGPAVVTNTTTGVSQPPLGGGQPGAYSTMDLNSIVLISPGPASVQLILENFGYGLAPDGLLVAKAQVGGTIPTGGTLTIQSYVNTLNAVPILGPDTFPAAVLGAVASLPPGAGDVPIYPVGLGTNSFPAGAFSSPAGVGPPPWSVLFTKSGVYSMFTVVDVVFGAGGGTVSFDAQHWVDPVVPAPTSLVLALTAIPVLGLFWLRRRMKGRMALAA